MYCISVHLCLEYLLYRLTSNCVYMHVCVQSTPHRCIYCTICEYACRHVLQYCLSLYMYMFVHMYLHTVPTLQDSNAKLCVYSKHSPGSSHCSFCSFYTPKLQPSSYTHSIRTIHITVVLCTIYTLIHTHTLYIHCTLHTHVMHQLKEL